MPKALFFNVPAHGHVNPSLPLVAELVRRGHDITYFLTESYRAKIEATGATFHPYATIRDDYFDGPGLDGTRPQRTARYLITTVEKIMPELLDVVREMKPDYILYDGMCPWGYFVAKAAGLPAVASLSLLPLPAPSAILNWQMLKLMVPMVMRDFGMGLEANRKSQMLGKQYNVPPLGAMSILNAEGDLSISYSSAYFVPGAETVSKSVKFVGWTLNEPPVTEPFSFEQVKGRPLVYASLGTLANDNPAFFKACIEAFAGSEYYLMMSTGKRLDPTSFGTLPENVAIYNWVPQIEVLRKAALFITHAGLNSVHDGLYFGVPELLVPQQEEQTITAMRVAELGAGLMLKKAQVTAQSVRENATRLLTEARFKAEAQKIGETLRNGGGMTKAVDEIEGVLALTPSPSPQGEGNKK